MAYLSKGRNEDAYKSFLLVRRLYPNNWIAPFGLALLHAGSGDQEQARALLVESFGLGGKAARREAAPSHSSEVQSEWLHQGALGHFNDAGNRLAAEILERFFEEQGKALP